MKANEQRDWNSHLVLMENEDSLDIYAGRKFQSYHIHARFIEDPGILAPREGALATIEKNSFSPGAVED
jgi:hypothetical protein